MQCQKPAPSPGLLLAGADPPSLPQKRPGAATLELRPQGREGSATTGSGEAAPMWGMGASSSPAPMGCRALTSVGSGQQPAGSMEVATAVKQELRAAGGLPPSPPCSWKQGNHHSKSPGDQQMSYWIVGAGFELEMPPCRVESDRESEVKMHFLGQKAEGEKQERTLLFPINTADSSRRAFCFKSGLFVFFHLQNFALKIYTSLFKNQTRSAKKKPIQNPEKRPERAVRHSRTPA